MGTSRSAATALILVVAASAVMPAAAQQFPSKSIRMVVGFPPGGAVDIVARIVGAKVAENVGQQIVIDNRAGAGSAIATEISAKAPPDGYTVYLTASTIAVNVSLYKDQLYDPRRTFAPVILVASAPNVFVVNPGQPMKTIPQLIELAKAKPGALNFGSGGSGTLTHLSGELLKLMANVDITHVPYKGAAPALNDVISGQLQMMVSSLPGALTQIRAGRVVALAVTSAKRSGSAPEIPTVAESGVPGYDATNWYGLLAPAATQGTVVQKLNREFLRALNTQDVQDALMKQGADTLGGTPAAFRTYMNAEVTKWAKVISAGNIRAD